MNLYVGDDWAEAHHDVHLMNEAGERMGMTTPFGPTLMSTVSDSVRG